MKLKHIGALALLSLGVLLSGCSVKEHVDYITVTYKTNDVFIVPDTSKIIFRTSDGSVYVHTLGVAEPDKSLTVRAFGPNK